MRQHPARLLSAAALCSALALPAAATPDGTVFELDLVEQNGEVVAVVTLDHVMGLGLELDLSYELNGQTVKVDPVQVFNRTVYWEPVGDPALIHAVCTSIDGLVRITGDLTHPTEGQRCDLWHPRDSRGSTRGRLRGADIGGRLPVAPTAPAVPLERRSGATVETARR